jgi:thioredoxin
MARIQFFCTFAENLTHSKLKKTLLTILFLGVLAFGCNGQSSKDFETISAQDFSQKIRSTPTGQILDVRTPKEYADQHLDNALNIDWNGDDFEGKVQKLDKTKPVFVYCMAGARSKSAANKLHELGFKEIYNLDGGILKWNAAGLAPKSDKIIGMCSQEFGELLNSDKKVLVNFYADWCNPCKKMAPYLLRMQKEMADKVTIVRLNADENKTLIAEMKIDELPTLLLYDHKKMKWKHTGFVSEEDLKKQLQ